MDQLESVHKVKEWSKGPPTYYLCHDYKRDKRGKWWIGCKKYLDEAIKTIEKYSGIWLRGVIQKRLLPYFRRKSTQQLSDVNWYFKLGNMPWPHRHCLCSVISLSRFSACPREGHLNRALRVFGYLKKNKNRRIILDSRDPIYVGGADAMTLDFTQIFHT